MKAENLKLRLLILTHGGCESLLEELSTIDSVEVAGVIVETERSRKVPTLRERIQRSIRYDGYWDTFAKLFKQFTGTGSNKENYAAVSEDGDRKLTSCCEKLGVPIHFLSNFHTDDSIAFMRRQNADLGIVWGTNILKESVFKIPRMGSINIHQGLAPYYRGGPPVFWELFNNEPEVGITVHFVEAKVDTGAIIKQETIPLEYDYSYGLDYEPFINEFRAKMAATCVTLMTQAVKLIASNTAQLTFQDISLGKRYRLPLKPEKDEMKRRLIERAGKAGWNPTTLKRRKSGIFST